MVQKQKIVAFLLFAETKNAQFSLLKVYVIVKMRKRKTFTCLLAQDITVTWIVTPLSSLSFARLNKILYNFSASTFLKIFFEFSNTKFCNLVAFLRKNAKNVLPFFLPYVSA